MKPKLITTDLTNQSNESYWSGGMSKNPVGRPAKGNVQYKRNIPPEFVKLMDEHLNELKQKPIVEHLKREL